MTDTPRPATRFRLSTRPGARDDTCGQTRSRWMCTLPADHEGLCSWERAEAEPRQYGDRGTE